MVSAEQPSIVNLEFDLHEVANNREFTPGKNNLQVSFLKGTAESIIAKTVIVLVPLCIY